MTKNVRGRACRKDRRNVYKILVRNPEWKRQLGSLRMIMKRILQEIGCDDVGNSGSLL